jgi:hypothetical protein
MRIIKLIGLLKQRSRQINVVVNILQIVLGIYVAVVIVQRAHGYLINHYHMVKHTSSFYKYLIWTKEQREKKVKIIIKK